MNCPYCQQPMENGFLESSHTIFYSRVLHSSCGFCRPKKEDTKLTNSWVGAILPAWRCTACQKIILDMSSDEPEKERS